MKLQAKHWYLFFKFFFLSIFLLISACSLNKKSKEVDLNNNKVSSDSEKEESKEEEEEEEEEEDQGLGSDYNEIELLFEGIRSYDGERYSLAKTFFQKLIDKYPSSPFSIIAELKVADSLFKLEKFSEAIGSYRDFINVHSTNEAKPYAMYQVGMSYQKAYQGAKQDQTPIKEAVKAYVELINQFPNSYHTQKAKIAILECDKLLLESENEKINFYIKTGKTNAAKARYESAKKNYGHVPDFKNLLNIDESIFDETTKATKEDVEKKEENNLTENKKLELSLNPSESPIASLSVSESPSPSASSSPSPRETLVSNESPVPSISPLVEQSPSSSSIPSPSLSLNNPEITTDLKVEESPVTSESPVASQTTKLTPMPSATPTLVEIENINPAQATPGKTTENKPSENLIKEAKNSSLGLEYIKSLEEIKSNIKPNNLEENFTKEGNKSEPETNNKTLGSLEKDSNNVLKNINSDIKTEQPNHHINTFLKKISCESNENQTIIMLEANSAPILRSAKTEIVNGKFGQQTYENKIILQDKVLFAPIDGGNDIYGNNELDWKTVKSSNCKNSMDTISIVEKSRIDHNVLGTEPNTIVLIIVESLKERNFSISYNSSRDKLNISFK